MNSRSPTFTFSTARPSRAQFSPLVRRVALPRLPTPDPQPALATREFAERSFLSSWARPGLLDRAQPLLTRYRE
jgi:hypothetical protein